MDLIDRAALWQTFGEAQKSNPMADHGRGYADNFLNDAMEPSTEWFAVEEMVLKQPTIEAVPLDKLCEWLSEHSVNIPCETCRHFSNDYCTAIGDMDKPCPNKAEDWQKAIKEWMEGLNAAD